MADISNFNNKYSYEERLAAKDLWDNFFKSQMSSIYNDDSINSTIFSSLVRAFSGFIGSLDLVFEDTVEFNSLEEIPSELLYTHFGFLLRGKRAEFSLEEYRSFLKALLDILFKGLSRDEATNNLPSRFNVESININFPTQQRNTSLKSVGLNHINSILDLNGGFSFNSYNDGNNYFSSKESNYILIDSVLDQDSSFNLLGLRLIFDIIDLIGSAISPKRVTLRVESKSSFSGSSSVKVDQRHTTTRFRSIDKHIIHYPSFSEPVSPVYVFPEDSYSHLSVDATNAGFSPEYAFLVEDFYNVTVNLAENLPRVAEEVRTVPICSIYGEFTYGDASYGCSGLETRYMDPYNFSSFVLGGQLGVLEQPEALIGEGLVVGNFIIS